MTATARQFPVFPMDPPPMPQPPKRTPPRHIVAQENAYRHRLIRQELRERARAEALEVSAGVHETAALATARGEAVVHQPSGALRISNRDAVYSLTHKLTDDQDAAAREVRDCYEARSAGLGSQMGGIGEAGGSAFDSNDTAIAGVQRAKKLQRLGNIERGVLIGSYRMTDGTLRMIGAWNRKGTVLPHVALTMMQGVCGQNVALSSFGEGRAFERNLAALILALDVADEIIHCR